MSQSTSQISLHVGVCGFCLPQAELFRRFRLLEVQQTFYKPPQRKTVERWRQIAPEGFEFTLKAFQVITHGGYSPTYRKVKLTADQLAQCGDFRDTALVRDGWNTTRDLAEALEARFVVFQCPPRFAATETNIAQMRRFFTCAIRGDLRLVWEPRHSSWTPSLVTDLCRELDLIHAVDPLETEAAFGTPRYYRLHGTATGHFRYNYDHPYTDTELQMILAHSAAAPTYCLFNNVQMATDAARFEAQITT